MTSGRSLGEDAGDAGQRLALLTSSRTIRAHALRAAEDLGVEHQREREIATVRRHAHGLAQRIHAAQRLADLAQLGEVVGGGGVWVKLTSHASFVDSLRRDLNRFHNLPIPRASAQIA